MTKTIIILMISLAIFILTYLASKNNRAKKGFICSGLVAALAFAGSEIVKCFEREEPIVQEIENSEDKKFDYEQDVNVLEEKEITDTEKEQSELEKSASQDVEYITYISETHTPSGVAEHVNVSSWIEDEDYDISGQMYDGGVKITIYDMFSALEGNRSNILTEITSEVHYALNTEAIGKLPIEEQRFVGKFVVGKDTDGSPSTAVISILLDGEEVYNSGEINCYSISIPPFDCPISKKREMVIKIVCQHKGNPLVIGMVNSN